MKAKFIINPSSGTQDYLKHIESIVGCLILNKVVRTIDVFYTKEKGDALEAARCVAPGEYDFLVSVGGDGTLNDVVNGVMLGKSHTPIALIAMGTANEFAHYDHEIDTAEAFCHMIKQFKIREIDVGKINNAYFISRVSGGLGANVNDRVSQESKAVLGKLAYYMENVLDFSKKGIEPVRVRFDSEEFHGGGEVISFYVLNSCLESGFFSNISQEISDSELQGLDVVIVKKMALGHASTLGIHALKKTMTKHPKIRHFKTNRVRIESQSMEPISVDYDGQIFGELPIEISIIPKAIRIIVP